MNIDPRYVCLYFLFKKKVNQKKTGSIKIVGDHNMHT